jgi:hypothetical protein
MHTHVIMAEDINNRGAATVVLVMIRTDDAGGCAPERGGMLPF